MWLCLKEGFMSIVDKDVPEGYLIVRGRRKEHILAYFPDADVKHTGGPDRDYHFRAQISREEVAKVVSDYILNEISEGNFKASVKDRLLHNTYMSAWGVFARLQEIPPYQ